MKKMVTLCTVLALAIAFASCSSDGGSDSPPPSPPGGDTTPPTVVSVMPANNSVNVPTAGNIVITFSEAMDTTVGTVMGFSNNSGTWDTAKKVYTIPYENIAPGATVTITISGFKDVAGNVMTAAYTSVFTTTGAVSPNAKPGLYDHETIGDTDEPLVAFDKTSAATATSTFNQAITYVNTNANISKSFSLVLDNDVSVTTGTTLSPAADLRIVGLGSNRTITLTDRGSLFTVGPSARLVLREKIMLKGNAANTSALVKVNGSGASLFMLAGSAIKDNTNTTNPGGGVDVSSGTFTMLGGEISGNTAASDSAGTHAGGGVYVGGSGKFIMEAGDIKNNTAFGGCGVYVDGGEFTMSGGKISGNTVENNGGATGIGVSVTGSSGKFTMTDGEISGNNFTTGIEFFGGGGVSVYDHATFTMSGGEIKNNTLTSSSEYGTSGGGVYVFDGGIFKMSGGKITGNKATNSSSDDGYGGGVYVMDEGKFTMTGGEISGNTAGWGGGVFVDEDGTFTMSGESSIIKTNTANVRGGGVAVAFGEFTMNGGKISSNIITDDTGGSGGGVSVGGGNGTFTMNGGEISGHTVSYRGGGVYAEAAFIMKGGEIYNNKTADTNSGDGGGVYVLDCFDMEGGKIYGNTAGNGGGVYLEGTLSSYFNMKGGEIYGNTAAMMGGGVCLSVGKFQMAGGTIYGSNEADTSKRNKTTTANQGAALNKSSDSDVTAKYGTFNSSGVFSGTAFPGGTGVLYFENTVKVVNGVLVP